MCLYDYIAQTSNIDNSSRTIIEVVQVIMVITIMMITVIMIMRIIMITYANVLVLALPRLQYRQGARDEGAQAQQAKGSRAKG